MINNPLISHIPLLCLLLCLSCAHTQKMATPLTAEEQMNLVEKKLLELEEEAKSQGNETVLFFASDLFLKADRSSLDKDSYSAALLYRHLLNLLPKDRFIKQKLAFEYIRQEEFDLAKKLIDEVLAQEPNNEKALMQKAHIHFLKLDKVVLEETLTKILTLNKSNAEALFLLVQFYTEESLYKKAITLLEQSEKNFLKNKEALGQIYYEKGKKFQELGQDEKAKEQWKKAIETNSTSPLPVMALGKYFEEKQEFEKALSLYQQFLDKIPAHPLILNRIVELLFQKEEYQKATPYLDLLHTLDPSDLNLTLKLAILYMEQDQPQKAKNLLLELKQEAPESEKLDYYLGIAYKHMQEVSISNSYFEKIDLEGEYGEDTILQLAQNYSLENENKFFSFIKKQSQKNEKLKLLLGVLLTNYLESLERYSEAQATLEELRPLPLFGEEHLYYLATLYEKQRLFHKAYKIIEEILAKNPKNAHAWNFWGYSLLEQGESYDLAYAHIQKALALSPKDGMIRDSLGWYYFKIKNFHQALTELKRAYEANSNDPTISKHLGLVYHKLERYDEALYYYKKALGQKELDEKDRHELQQLIHSLPRATSL